MKKCILMTLILMMGCKAMPVYVGRESAAVYKNPVQPVTSGSSATSGNTSPVKAGTITAAQQDAMMEEIKSWMGTPYGFGTIEKGKSVDCSGFVGSVFKAVLSVELPRQSGDMYKSGRSIQKSELRFGDLVFLENTYKGATGASHVGIYVGNDEMAHASTTVGVTISKLSDGYYVKHYLGCRRVIE